MPGYDWMGFRRQLAAERVAESSSSHAEEEFRRTIEPPRRPDLSRFHPAADFRRSSEAPRFSETSSSRTTQEFRRSTEAPPRSRSRSPHASHAFSNYRSRSDTMTFFESSLDDTIGSLDTIERELRKKSKDLTTHQDYHMRHSPPIQPGESKPSERLPSFNEFLSSAGAAHTPPGTPSRRNGSSHSSPRTQPQPHFENPWQHRRNDTLGDIYARPSQGSEPSPFEHHRVSSVGHRPSLPESRPLHHAPSPPFLPRPSAGSIYQHDPSPGRSSFHHPSAVAPSHHYASPATHPGSTYGSTSSQYQPTPMITHPHDPYGRPSHPGVLPPGPHVQDYRFQQHVAGEGYQRRRRGNLPKEATNQLKAWYNAHKSSPYPNEEQKVELCNNTGLNMNQVSNWFINARRREPHREARERERAQNQNPSSDV